MPVQVQMQVQPYLMCPSSDSSVATHLDFDQYSSSQVTVTVTVTYTQIQRIY